MTAPDPHEYRLRWITALREANPDLQMRGYLTHYDYHCAIGIAAVTLQDELSVREDETCFLDADDASYCVTSAAMTIRLASLLDVDRPVLGNIIQLNDREHWTFQELADHLKETIL